MWTRVTLVGAVLAMIAGSSYWLAMAAFAGGEAASGPAASSAAVAHSASTAALSPEQLAELLGPRKDSLSPQEAAASADGVVTYDEREAAEQAYITCGEGAGYEAQVYPGSGQRLTRVSFLVPGGDSPDSSVATGGTTLSKCAAEYMNDVDVVWELQLAAAEPSPADTAALYDRLDHCLATKAAAWLGDVPWYAEVTHVYKNAAGRNIVFPQRASDEVKRTTLQCAVAEEAETGLAFPAPTGEACVQGRMAFGMSEEVARQFCPE